MTRWAPGSSDPDLFVEATNRALDGIPPDRVRFHTCYGINEGPRVHDVDLAVVIPWMLQVRAAGLSFEGANPRHEHEWEVFKEIPLPDGKDLILGVIDVKVNAVEHPRLVAQRLTRLAGVVGKENVQAGTDCGFDTFIRFSLVDPKVAWLKLKSLADGAELATSQV